MAEKLLMSGYWPSLYEPFRMMGTRLSDRPSPAAEVCQTGEDYRIAVELSGMADDDIEVTVENGVVEIHGDQEKRA